MHGRRSRVDSVLDRDAVPNTQTNPIRLPAISPGVEVRPAVSWPALATVVWEVRFYYLAGLAGRKNKSIQTNTRNQLLTTICLRLLTQLQDDTKNNLERDS